MLDTGRSTGELTNMKIIEKPKSKPDIIGAQNEMLE